LGCKELGAPAAPTLSKRPQRRKKSRQIGEKTMPSGKKSCAALALGLAALFLGAPAQAAKLGPYFPLPATFPLSGPPKQALLNIQATWLQNGLDNLGKAKKETEAALEKAKAPDAKPEDVAALEEKLKTLDADIAATKDEIELANDADAPIDRQAERKRRLMLNVNQWINEIGRQATQALKKAILSDGMEAQIAENQHVQLSELADAIEKAKHDVSVENWAATR
jgi:hypothetical protein